MDKPVLQKLTAWHLTFWQQSLLTWTIFIITCFILSLSIAVMWGCIKLIYAVDVTETMLELKTIRIRNTGFIPRDIDQQHTQCWLIYLWSLRPSATLLPAHRNMVCEGCGGCTPGDGTRLASTNHSYTENQTDSESAVWSHGIFLRDFFVRIQNAHLHSVKWVIEVNHWN